MNLEEEKKNINGVIWAEKITKFSIFIFVVHISLSLSLYGNKIGMQHFVCQILINSLPNSLDDVNLLGFFCRKKTLVIYSLTERRDRWNKVLIHCSPHSHLQIGYSFN